MGAPSALLALGIALATSLGLVGCGSEEASGRGGGRGGGGGFQRPPTPVEVSEVTPTRVVDRFEAVGTIEAADAVTIVSEIPGIVARLPFREGAAVERGALLAQLEDSEPRAALARAEALRDQRQAAFDRVRMVVDRGAGTPQDLDDAAAELKIAEADVDLARARLAKTRIVAPFNGAVGPRLVSPGAFVQAGTPITTLQSIQKLRVRFTAPEQYVPRFQPSAEVHISTPAFPGQRVAGTIDVIDPGLNPETRSVEVLALLPNPDRRFRPGMSADIEAVLDDRAQALTVPDEAVFVEGDAMFVYQVQADSTVTRTAVELGTRLADKVEIRAGLTAGARVVRAGHQKLYEGARVFPVTSQPGAGGPPGRPGAGQAGGDETE